MSRTSKVSTLKSGVSHCINQSDYIKSFDVDVLNGLFK
jgi:hypothetical protein